MAIRGTTPDYILTVNADLSNKTVYVTISQLPGFILTMTNDDIDIVPGAEESAINISLTQEQTLLLVPGTAEIQVKFIGADGTTRATDIQRITIDRALLNKVVTYNE